MNLSEDDLTGKRLQTQSALNHESKKTRKLHRKTRFCLDSSVRGDFGTQNRVKVGEPELEFRIGIRNWKSELEIGIGNRNW